MFGNYENKMVLSHTFHYDLFIYYMCVHTCVRAHDGGYMPATVYMQRSGNNSVELVSSLCLFSLFSVDFILLFSSMSIQFLISAAIL